MLAAILALSSSFLIGVNSILMKKSIERTGPTSAMMAVTFIGSVIFLIISFFKIPFSYFKSDALIYFAIAGLFSPALVRWLYFISLDRIGPSVSSSIFATGPAFTAIIAIILLDEKITLQIAVGIITIIGGIALLERDMNKGHGAGYGCRSSKDLIYPLLAALFFSFAVATRKLGLNSLDSPIFGVTVGFVTSMVAYSLVCLGSKKMRSSIAIKWQDLPLFLAAGIFLTAAWLSLFYALSHGEAIIVTPLANLHPLFVLVLSYFFLGRTERLTKSILAGACIVVAGVLLITTGHV